MATATEIQTANAKLISDRAAGIAVPVKTQAEKDQAALTGNLDFFLKMLTTQLKQQDPTQPMDVNQMTQQIATLSSVQQQVNTNTNLEKLLAQGTTSQLSTAVSYLSKEVETKGSTGQVIGGQGSFAYVLPSDAASVKVTIKNAAGSVVFQGNGSTKSGRNLLVWDGVNSTSGTQEPDGTYTIAVTATDSSQKAITAEARAVGIVGGVQTDSTGAVVLTVGDTTVKYSDILAVREPTRANLDTAQTGSGSSG